MTRILFALAALASAPARADIHVTACSGGSGTLGHPWTCHSEGGEYWIQYNFHDGSHNHVDVSYCEDVGGGIYWEGDGLWYTAAELDMLDVADDDGSWCRTGRNRYEVCADVCVVEPEPAPAPIRRRAASRR